MADKNAASAGENPATRIQFFREESRDRFVQPEELPRLFAAIAQEPSIYIRTALLTALLTGARRQEVLTMQWQDLSVERAAWRIPQTKANRPHLLPLPRPTRQPEQDVADVQGGPLRPFQAVPPNRIRPDGHNDLSKAGARAVFSPGLDGCMVS